MEANSVASPSGVIFTMSVFPKLTTYRSPRSSKVMPLGQASSSLRTNSVTRLLRSIFATVPPVQFTTKSSPSALAAMPTGPDNPSSAYVST